MANSVVLSILGLLIFCTSTSLYAQELGTKLQIVGRSGPLAIPVGISMPVVGNEGFYARLSSPTGDDDCIRWYASNGEKITVFQFNNIPRSVARRESKFDIADMTSLPGGGLAMLGIWTTTGDRSTDSSIELFQQDGGYKGSVTIPPGLHPVHLGALKTGFVVVAGKEQSDGFGAEVMLILDSSGRILETRTIGTAEEKGEHSSLPGLAAKASDGNGDDRAPGESKEWRLWETISSARIVSGADGDVYLLHRDSTGASFRVRSNATIDQFKLSAPPLASGEKAIVFDGIEIAGKLTVEYLIQKQDAPTLGTMKYERLVLGLYSAQDPGQSFSDYYLKDTSVSPFLVGVDDSRFLFLSFAPDALGVRQRTIVTVAP